MTRPAGVTVSAVVSIIGSVIALLFSVLFVVVVSTQADQTQGLRGAGYLMAVFAAALGTFGIFTAMALMRLRPWARTAILVFAGIMAVFSFMGGVVMTMVPLPPTPELPANAATSMRWILIGIYVVPFLIGVWWLIQFNLKATKAAFASAAPGEPEQRPLVISIIGWFNIVGGVFTLGAAALRAPAFAAGVVLTGWYAALFYVFVGAVNAYLGWHLLKLDERARILTIWWFAITIGHTAFLALSPTSRARMREFQEMIGPKGEPASPMDMTMFTVGSMVLGALLLVAAIWPLISKRSAFVHAGIDDKG